MSLRAQKSEARVAAKARRATAHAAYKGLGGGLFIQPFIGALHPAPGQVVAAYVAKGTEADPGPLVALLAAHDCRIALPRILGPDMALSFRLWSPGDPLVPGPFGVQEPRGEAEALPDFVIMPLLAFSPDGHRLGYGGGYYDRTLEALRAQKPGIIAVGLAFAAQEVTNLPVEPEDEPLDWIVTERGARSF